MKKVLLSIYLLFSVIVITQAQNTSGSVKLRLILSPIQTLVVNSAQESIDLEYTETSDYINGVSSEQKDHIKINSTGAFTVDVQSVSNNIKRASGDESISSNTLSVRAATGTTNSMPDATMGQVNLSATAANLISSKKGGMGRNFNITYSGVGADGYINDFHNDESPTIYTTTVTYTIAAN